MTFAAVVISELIACATADFPLAAIRALSVNTAFTRTAVMRAQQTLINVSKRGSMRKSMCGGQDIRRESKTTTGQILRSRDEILQRIFQP